MHIPCPRVNATVVLCIGLRIIGRDASRIVDLLCCFFTRTVPKPGPRTANVGDASGLVKIAMSNISPRVVVACVLLHRDDRNAVRVCAKYHLLVEMNSKLQ